MLSSETHLQQVHVIDTPLRYIQCLPFSFDSCVCVFIRIPSLLHVYTFWSVLFTIIIDAIFLSLSCCWSAPKKILCYALGFELFKLCVNNQCDFRKFMKPIKLPNNNNIILTDRPNQTEKSRRMERCRVSGKNA